MKFHETEIRGHFVNSRVLLNFCTEIDWLKCFPLGSDSQVPDFDEDVREWAGVTMCGDVMGLAVFASQQSSSVHARVQPVPMVVFGRLITS